MYTAHSQLVHHATVHHYRPGQEDMTLRVLSSASSDAGIWTVLQETQGDPIVYRVQPFGIWAWLRAIGTRRLAALPSRVVGRETGGRVAGISDPSSVLPSQAQR